MAEREVIWVAAAQRDLDDIIDYIADEQPLNAMKVFERLQARALTLKSQSLRGRLVPELRGLGAAEYRELIESPWRMIYRLDRRRIYVLAVLDSRRDLQTLLLERLLQAT